MTEIIGVSIPIIISLGVFAMIVLLRRMENQEKLKMIEKGMDLNLPKKENNNTGTALKFALIAVGVGIGLLVGNVLDVYTPLKDEVCYFSMVFLFGGLGLFIANKMVENKRKNEEKS
ncbi:MAG: hypothetical protein P1U44_01585 [Vicingaceae bacterium]|nr:hypothetical protein [Flavobacteriales bacterium]MBQ20033.1 hypothetical protein [Flavobacteriales bacterium]MDF1674377.1 hypothetical protein [Vicingaceae bacterium]|tara:strand:- start:2835 stop:3185 length:351 start_codon:yes stop_codon:yes gene_type:complete